MLLLFWGFLFFGVLLVFFKGKPAVAPRELEWASPQPVVLHGGLLNEMLWMQIFLLAQYVMTLSLTLKEETKKRIDKWLETLPSFTGFVLLSVCTSCFSCKVISSCPKTLLCRELQYNKL